MFGIVYITNAHTNKEFNHMQFTYYIVVGLSFLIFNWIFINYTMINPVYLWEKDHYRKTRNWFIGLCVFNIIIVGINPIFKWKDELVEIRKQKELQKGGCYYQTR